MSRSTKTTRKTTTRKKKGMQSALTRDFDAEQQQFGHRRWLIRVTEEGNGGAWEWLDHSNYDKGSSHLRRGLAKLVVL